MTETTGSKTPEAPLLLEDVAEFDPAEFVSAPPPDESVAAASGAALLDKWDRPGDPKIHYQRPDGTFETFIRDGVELLKIRPGARPPGARAAAPSTAAPPLVSELPPRTHHAPPPAREEDGSDADAHERPHLSIVPDGPSRPIAGEAIQAELLSRVVVVSYTQMFQAAFGPHCEASESELAAMVDAWRAYFDTVDLAALPPWLIAAASMSTYTLRVLQADETRAARLERKARKAAARRESAGVDVTPGAAEPSDVSRDGAAPPKSDDDFAHFD